MLEKNIIYLDKLFGKTIYIDSCPLNELIQCRNFMLEVYNYLNDKDIQAKKKSGNPMCDYEEMLSVGWNKDVPYVIWPQKLIGQVIDSIKYRRNVEINVQIKDGRMKFDTKERTV